MPTIHPTAILTGDIALADDVSIGPYCVLTGPLTIGAGTRLMGNNYLTGPATIGPRNTFYPFAAVGFAPQDLSFDPLHPGPGIVMGEGNTIREQVTIHRATREDKPTQIGNHNYIMIGAHLGHDSIIGDHCVLVNYAAVGGHVRLDDRVVISGVGGIHQFCRAGRGAFIAGGILTTKDLPPWFMLTGNNCAGSLNVVGMRRNNLSQDQIADIKWVFKILYRRGLSMAKATVALEERGDNPTIKEYLDFIHSSERGIVRGRPDPRR